MTIKINKRLLIGFSFIMSQLAFSTALTSCSDSDLEEMNTDPSKAANIDPNAQLTTAELQTYGDLNQVEIYRNYFYAFTQQFMGCWNTTNFGGRHTVDNTEMGRTWTTFYPMAIKNLVDGIYASKDDEKKQNINAVLNIYKVYMMSLITDTYGDVPYKDAGLGFLESVANPRYDTQEEIYTDFFEQLDKAEQQLDKSGDRVTGDVIYGGDVLKWKKLANSLRLRYAMRISDVDPKKAQQEFEKALAAKGGIIEDGSDDALIKYMSVSFSFGSEAYEDYRVNRLSQLLFGNDPANNPTYICSTLYNQLHNTSDPRENMIARFYCDVKMSSTSPDNRIDITEELNANGLAAPRDPGAYSWEPWPSGYYSDIVADEIPGDEDAPNMYREVEPKLANNFLKGDNPGVVITSAEVKFLLAEATVKGWKVNRGSVEDLYNAGVRAAIDFLTDNYGCAAVSDDAIDAYIAANGVGSSAEERKKNINTQAWILHLTNPAECWANQRRSNYPLLKSPAEYGFGSFLTGGAEIPVRLLYPVLESSYNKQGYEDALSRVSGTYDWHLPLWWDK